MPLPLWILLIIAGVAVLSVVFYFAPIYVVASKIYSDILVRTSKEKWSRECSATDNEEQVAMYETGAAWAEKHAAQKKDVDIVSDGFRLFGEYFDLGFKRAVIVIAGRTEGCRYSYYFAPPYAEAGFNVLVIDNRSHGLSDGKYNCLGLKEYVDILAWGRLLHEQYGNETVVCHGICIGSATAIKALTQEDCPDYMEGLVADGMYVTFYESFKNHLIEDKRPLFPFLNFFTFIGKRRSGVDFKHDGPLYCIDKMRKPILFLYSKEDKFSKPDKGEVLYDKCGSDNKTIVWFDKGAHSHIRINNQEKYDDAVKAFLKENFR